MRDGWALHPLGELATFHSGGTPRKDQPEFWGGDVPWISGASLTNARLCRSDRRLTELGVVNGSRLAPQDATLILVRGMSLLEEVRIGHAMRPLAFNQDVKALVAAEGVHLWFLTYALLAQTRTLLGMVHLAGHGTGVLASDRLKSLLIPLPSLEEQRRIAGVLVALDDLIETNRRLADSSTAMWRVLLDEALTDADGSTPLSSIADFVNGKNFTKGASGTGRPVIRTPEVRRGPVEGTVYSDVEAADDLIAHVGDTLFVWSGSLMVSRWLWEDGLINQHIFKVRSHDGVPPWLVLGLIERQMPQFLRFAADKATTMGHIKRAQLDELVPLPSRDELARLAKVIEPLWNQGLSATIEAQAIARTRDELLPLLLSGAIRVDEVAA